MKRLTLLLLVSSISTLAHAATADKCAEGEGAPTLEDRTECLAKGLSQTQRAAKMLEQRLQIHMEEIGRTGKSAPELTYMADIAIQAKDALKTAKDTVEKTTKLQQEINEHKLKTGGTQASVDAAKLASEAHVLAGQIVKLRTKKEEADKKVNGLIDELSNTTDSDAQKRILVDIKRAEEEAGKRKKAYEEARATLAVSAGKIDVPTAGNLERDLGLKATSLYKENAAAVIAANNVMLGLLGPFNRTAKAPATQTDEEKAERLAFLRFLQSHPLLESEVSGSGIQISSTSGDGRVTIKPEFQWGRSAYREVAFSVSAPINKDENQMSPAKNNVLLDKLAGDTTVKAEYTKLAPFNPDKYGNRFWLAGLSGELGYQEFSYFDPNISFANPAKPEKVKEHNTSYALTVYAGFSPSDANDLYLIRFSRQYKREGQAAVALCPPMTPGAAYVTCPSGVLGAPEGKKFNIMSAEWRHRFKYIALSATMSYDRTSKVRAVAVPIFFSLMNRGFGAMANGEPQFSAGLQLGWRSDTKASVGVFAGLPFSLVSN